MNSNNPFHYLILGDNRLAGWIRLFFLVVIPLGLLITICIYSLLYQASFLLGIFLILYFLGLISAFKTATDYINDIYNEKHKNVSFSYLAACFFGWNQPQIDINQTDVTSIKQKMVEKIGGPAILNIKPGFLVLTEELDAMGKVYGSGEGHFMSRKERIYEIIDLREQEGIIDSITATTKDGIKVTVEKTKFNYRIWDPRWGNLYKDMSVTRNPYPYSKQAIFDYAYNRPVALDAEGNPQMVSWPDAVKGRVAGIIKDYISEHRLDDIIAPRDQEKMDVRDEIRKKAYLPSFKESLRSIGAILSWWDPGEFSSIEDVETQYISNWSVDIVSNVKINEAYGRAQKLAYEEMGRAEAEAEFLMSIIHSMDGVQLSKNKVQTLQNLILLHTAQVIKALNNTTNPSKDSEHPSA